MGVEAGNSDPATGIPYQVDLYRAVEGQSLGDLPLLVIARAKSAADPEPWIGRQQRLAALSRKGRLVRAVGSGHDIELEQPGTVVDGIRSVIGPLRGSR